MQSKRPMSERNNAPQTKTSLVTGAKAIKSMRDIMIALSYIPIVFFAVCSIIYSHFPPLDAEIYSQYVLTGMCGVVVVFAVTLLFKKKLMFGLVAKSGLWLIAASFLLGACVCWWGMAPRFLVMSVVFYLLGLIVFSLGTWTGWVVKTIHVAFSLIAAISGAFLSQSPQAAVAVLALSIVGYPMLASYASVRWASAEFFKLK